MEDFSTSFQMKAEVELERQGQCEFCSTSQKTEEGSQTAGGHYCPDILGLIYKRFVRRKTDTNFITQ